MPSPYCGHSTPEERGERRRGPAGYWPGDHPPRPPSTAEIRGIAPGGEVHVETIEVSSDEVRAIGEARAYARSKAEKDPTREYHAFVKIEGRSQWLCGWYFGPVDETQEAFVPVRPGESISRGPGILNPYDMGLFVGDRRRPMAGHTGGY